MHGVNGLTSERLTRMRLYLWPHRLLYIGPGVDAGMHRHHAAQICSGLDGLLRMRMGPQAEWQERSAFYVPPDRPHEFNAAGTTTAILYLESECAELAALQARIDRTVWSGEPDPVFRAAEGLRGLALAGGSIDTVASICLAWLGLDHADQQHRKYDPRIVAALGLIRAQLDQPVRLATLAHALKVSPSWLSHRFAAETGVPLRRYVVWQRLRLAVESVLRGCSWTEAAHAVGFSDSAHLSRSFRETFGIAPSSLFKRRDQLSIEFSD